MKRIAKVGAAGWRILACDRRKRAHHKSLLALFAFILLWVATAYGATTDTNDPFQTPGWKAFLAAVGLIQVLVGYIYISGIAALNKKLDRLADENEELRNNKMDRAEHDRICNS
jgi:hypothetical protein